MRENGDDSASNNGGPNKMRDSRQYSRPRYAICFPAVRSRVPRASRDMLQEEGVAEQVAARPAGVSNQEQFEWRFSLRCAISTPHMTDC
jgi:hypothetical protein